MQAWKVFYDGYWIDTVYYDKDCDAEYVRETLINHDGHNPGITVRKAK
jgi:hypothetical protein